MLLVFGSRFLGLILKKQKIIGQTSEIRMSSQKDRKDTVFVFELQKLSAHNTKKRRTQHTCAQHTNTEVLTLLTLLIFVHRAMAQTNSQINESWYFRAQFFSSFHYCVVLVRGVIHTIAHVNHDLGGAISAERFAHEMQCVCQKRSTFFLQFHNFS